MQQSNEATGQTRLTNGDGKFVLWHYFLATQTEPTGQLTTIEGSQEYMDLCVVQF